MPKVGVFICHCGTNIAGVVDIKRVLEEIRMDRHVDLVVDNQFMCSNEGQNLIKKYIKERGLNRVVVAACTPKLHEETFRRVLSEAGLNPYLLEIANIREQCSWVHHHDPDMATVKAIDIIRGAIHKALVLEEVGVKESKINRSALVIGGGIAGIQASLDLASMGIKVYLVERGPVLGGNMARHDKVYPTMDCSQCILAPKMVEAHNNDKIEIFTLSEVIDVSGHVGDFRVRIRRRPRFVDISKCTACNICSEKCPSRVMDREMLGIGYRKAIYIPYRQAVPRAYLIDEDNCLYLKEGKCRVCERFCPTGAIDFDDRGEEIEINVGAIIVATGFKEFDPTPIREYGYGKFRDVLTNMELTRLLHPEGPTGGKLLRPSNMEPAKSIVFIQCVGSRDERFHKYCSRICCMASLKLAYLIKSEKGTDIDVSICYIDLRAYGKGFEEYLERVKEMGVKFIRGKPSEIRYDRDRDKLVVRVYDTVLNEYINLYADIVSLAAALEPSDGSRDLARILNIDVDQDGFYRELHPKLEPVSTKIPGIYICGAGWGPLDIPESVAMAKAAASEASKILLREKVEIPLTIAYVDLEQCDGCGLCMDSCPYNAIQIIDTETGRRAIVSEISCRGCGACQPSCPIGAIQVRHYKHEQMLRMVEGLMGVVD